jgi:hypothetical protein
MSNLLQELDQILDDVEKLDEPWATAERPGTYTELRGAIGWLKGIVQNCRKWGFAIAGYGD